MQLPRPQGRGVRFLSGLVLWQLMQLIPVQILGILQILGTLPRFTIAGIAILHAMLLAILLAWRVFHRNNAETFPHASVPRTVWPWYVVAAAAVTAGSYLIFAVDIFSSFPNGSDAIAYHLPLAVRWLQSGSLALPASRVWRLSLPGNTEIGMMLLLAIGKESLVVLVNWIALATLAIAVYLLVKQSSRGNRVVAAITTLVVMTVPMFEFQAFSAYVDLFGTAFLAASVALLLQANAQEDISDGVYNTLIFLSAAACGVSIGAKPIYYLYGAVATLLSLFLIWRKSARLASRLTVFLLVVGTLLPSAFWFTRAVAATGNPVYPMRVAVGNHVIFAGYRPSQITDPTFDQNFVRTTAEWFIYPWTEWKRAPGYLMVPYGEGSGLGAAFASLVVVGVLFFACRALASRAYPYARSLLLAFLLSLLVWWFVLHRIPRFGLPIVVLACVLATPFIELMQARRKAPFAILLLASLAITCGISAFVPLHAFLGRARTARWQRADFYEYPAILDRLQPGSCVINYTRLDEKNFALAGSGLRNWVVPAFEVPSTLSPDFLRQHNSCFLAEIVSENEPAPSQIAPDALSLQSATAVKSGESNIRWRVWKVETQ